MRVKERMRARMRVRVRVRGAVVVLHVVPAAGQVPPQPQQPRRVGRVAPELHAAVGAEAEGLVDAEARGGGLGRRAAAQPAAAVQAQ